MNEVEEKPAFEGLIQSEKGRLDDLMQKGSQPALTDLVGYDFKGFNLQSLTTVIGTRKFKKGFYGDPSEDHIWGYNIRVAQNEIDQPWIALPSDENPRRLAFFKVYPAPSFGKHAQYANSIVVDYSQWDGYFFLNPTRYLLDYLVFPDPENRDLLLGISYFALGSWRTFAGYFLLERYNENHFH